MCQGRHSITYWKEWTSMLYNRPPKRVSHTCIDSKLVPTPPDLRVLTLIQAVQLRHVPCRLLVHGLPGSVAGKLVQKCHQHLRGPALDVAGACPCWALAAYAQQV